MSPSDSRNEEVLFDRALKLPEADRKTFLEEACGGDTALRAAVEALLRAHLSAADFLPSVIGGSRSPVQTTASLSEKPGDWIGRYRLLQKLGEGGCGMVYMAEQEEPVRRRVALKVIKLGMDTKEVIGRFEAERQALAMMDHPNIAKVLDAGATASGRPFFVMELVRGIPVTQYCDEHALATEQRLELFSQICQAIQHAHQKGIIHRDIKPSNILVTLHDGQPTPKVIDFGIAKATQGRLTDQTYFTAFEQFIGTPAYMSPEQAEMSGLDIDTRSDVYSLGVLLYELLAGRPPFDPKTFLAVGIEEVRRLIREVDPPKPSARLSTLTDADRATVAKQRATAPAQLSLVLAGDLDWIVMCCLEKDRTRRYATPSELVTDLQRYLRNEPVIARPPSTGYLLRKLIRRHKVGFAAGTAVAISLIAGLVASSVLLVRERAARERAVAAETTQSRLRREADANASHARSAATKSAQVARFMTDMLDGVGPSVALGRDTEVLRDILDNTVRRLDTELLDQPAVAADLRDTLGVVYLDLGQPAMAERLLRTAVATHRAVSGNASAETAASLTSLGRALGDLNNAPEAEATLREALAIRRQLYGNEHPLVADTLAALAQVYSGTRRIADARPLLQEALAIRRKTLGNEHPDVASALYDLGRLAQKEVDHLGAVVFLSEALAMRRKLLSPEHPDLAASLDALGFSDAHELDRQDEAAVVYLESFGIRHKVLGDDHPETLVSLLHLAAPKAAHDIPPESVALAREFVANQRRLLPRDSVYLGPSLLALASLENLSGRHPDEAQAMTQEALQLLTQARTSGTNLESDVVYAMMFFAWAKFVANAPAEGLVMAEESMKMARRLPEGITKALCTHTLAWMYVALGRREEAAKLFENVVPRLVGLLRQEAPMPAVDTAALGACYRTMGRVAESHQYLESALATNQTKFGSGGPESHIAYVQCEYGFTLLSEGRFAEAEAMLRQAIDNYDHRKLRPLPSRLQPRSRAVSGLGRALAGQGKFAEAEPLVLQAFQELQANESRIAGNRAAMVRESLDAVIALYAAWAESDSSKQPIAASWRKALEEFDSSHAQQEPLLANKT